MWTEPAAIAVQDRLFRALALLRVLVLANAVGVNIWERDNFAHPAAGAAVVVVLVAWTGIAILACRRVSWRTPWLLVADLALAVGTILVSPVLKGTDMGATIPGFWVTGALMAWAIQYRWQGGLLAAACLTVADVAVRDEISQTNYGNLFLLMIGGPLVGYMGELLQRMAVERDRAERTAAAAAERARLSRAVHDGVLQVLALVQRRGTEVGGDLAELGRLAGEQERALRALIHRQDAVTATPGAPVDLTGMLELLGQERPPVVSVATTGARVDLEESRARSVVDAVRACLDNVTKHVGPQARAWVLLEHTGDRVVVSVRDEGPGIPEGRLAEAEAEGRWGVAGSIRGRMDELGGRADLTTGPLGTEWELTVPVAAADG